MDRMGHARHRTLPRWYPVGQVFPSSSSAGPFRLVPCHLEAGVVVAAAPPSPAYLSLYVPRWTMLLGLVQPDRLQLHLVALRNQVEGQTIRSSRVGDVAESGRLGIQVEEELLASERPGFEERTYSKMVLVRETDKSMDEICQSLGPVSTDAYFDPSYRAEQLAP